MFDLMHYSEAEKNEIIASMVILVDTREKVGKNDHILNYFDSKNVAYKKKALKQGDYSFMIPTNEKLGIFRPLYFDRKIVVERKNSLSELAGNLSSDRERLKREFALAPSNKVMVVENATYEGMLRGEYKSDYSPISFWASVHSFWHEFNLPIIFLQNRDCTGRFILGYFTYYLKKYME